MSEQTPSAFARLPLVLCMPADVLEIKNPQGASMFFTVERWECCLRLTAIDEKRGWRAVVMQTKSSYSRKFSEALDKSLGMVSENSVLLLQASPDMLDWLGLVTPPATAPGPTA